jgi:hypothetical protein
MSQFTAARDAQWSQCQFQRPELHEQTARCDCSGCARLGNCIALQRQKKGAKTGFLYSALRQIGLDSIARMSLV